MSAFRIPVQWSIYIINSIDKTKFLCTTSPPTHHHSFFRNYPLYSFIWGCCCKMITCLSSLLEVRWTQSIHKIVLRNEWTRWVCFLWKLQDANNQNTIWKEQVTSTMFTGFITSSTGQQDSWCMGSSTENRSVRPLDMLLNSVTACSVSSSFTLWVVVGIVVLFNRRACRWWPDMIIINELRTQYSS